MSSLNRFGRWAPLACVLMAAAAAASPDKATPFRLSDLMRSLASDPEAREAVLNRLGQRPEAAGRVDAKQRAALRDAIKRRDWASVDRFPAMTIKGMGASLKLAGVGQPLPPPPSNTGGERVVEALAIPTGVKPPNAKSFWTPIAPSLDVGEALDPGRAKRFAASERLAHVLNRLAENDPNGRGQYAVALGSEVQTAPALLKLLLKSGHTLEAQDARALANFGDLRYRGRDVATPFWLDTGIAVPGDERPLVVPVTHSEHRFLIRGPTVNADLCFFFGVDGDAAFRPLATVDPAWTAGVIKHRYSGERALEAVRLASAIRRAYQAKSRAHPELAFGGYFPFGVCNDVNAMLELHMAKTVTLYPLTRSLRYFEGEGEVDALARRLPVDTRDAPDLKRIAQSLPVRRLRDLEFPKLRAALDVLQRETPRLADLDLFKK